MVTQTAKRDGKVIKVDGDAFKSDGETPTGMALMHGQRGGVEGQ